MTWIVHETKAQVKHMGIVRCARGEHWCGVGCDTVTRARGVRGEFCSIALILQQGVPFSQKSQCRTPIAPPHRTNPGPLDPRTTEPPHQYTTGAPMPRDAGMRGIGAPGAQGCSGAAGRGRSARAAGAGGGGGRGYPSTRVGQVSKTEGAPPHFQIFIFNPAPITLAQSPPT